MEPRALADEYCAIDSLPRPKETTMLQRLAERALSLCLAAMLTFAMLGSIDHLAQPDESAPQWAQNTPTRA